MRKISLPIAIFLILILSSASRIVAGPVPDTGQTQSYTDTFGEDSDYTINPPSYTKLDDQGNALPDSATGWVMVRDNVTGLIWEVKQNKDGAADYSNPHDADNTYTWYDSNPETNGGDAGTPGDGTDTEDFINTLNAAKFGGYSDWRLPTVKELTSIVNWGTYSPAVNTDYFPNTLLSYYWSSTTPAYYTSGAWLVDFDVGGIYGYSDKSYSNYVHAVRGGQDWSLDYLVINGDGTVTDTTTGLMWQQETSEKMTWESAISYCETLTLAGYDDWRMPNINELQSIVDYSKSSPSIDTTYFPDTVSSDYWSSTTLAYGSSDAWRVLFVLGNVYNNDKSASYYVRAVRAGQNWSLDHLVISSPVQGVTWVIGDEQDIKWDPKGLGGNVKISLSRECGKDGTFETIAESTENDGSFTWKVSWDESVNCMLRIEPLNDPDKGTTQGLFSISTLERVWITAKCKINFTQYDVTLYGQYTNGAVVPLDGTWSLSDPSLATLVGNTLTAQKNGRVILSAEHGGKTYSLPIVLLDPTTADDYEGSNNTQELADVLPAGEFWEAQMTEGDTDYYEVSLDQASLVEVVYFSSSTTSDTRIEVLDANGQLVAEAVSQNGEERVISWGDIAGPHYVRLTPDGDIDQNASYYISWVVSKYIDLIGPIEITITIGESKEGTVYNLLDPTLFNFTLSETTPVNIQFEPSSFIAEYIVQLLDAGNNSLGSLASSDGTSLNIPVGLGAGNYKLKVSQSKDIDAFHPFTVTLSESPENLEIEPNNTGDQANQIGKGQEIKGLLLSGDADIYSFSLPYPQFVKIDFKSSSTSGDYQIVLCKGDENNPIDGTISQNGVDVSLEVGLTGGKYLVKILSAGDVDDQALYTLSWSDSDKTDLEIEPNDTLEFANGIDPTTAKKGRIYSQSDKDIYGFVLSEESLFQINFTPTTTTGDYAIRLLNGAGSVIDQKTSTNGSFQFIKIKLPAGTYYFEVSNGGDLDIYSAYTVSMQTSAVIAGLKKLAGLSIEASSTSLDIDGTVQLAVSAIYSDASSVDVTSSAGYVSSDNAVLTVSTGGLVTGLSDGTGIISVTYQGKAAGINFTVGTPQEEAKQGYGNLIIVAGGSLSASDSLKDATLYITDLAYQKFKARNFKDEDIYFMTQTAFHDLDGDGYDDKIVDDLTPTVSELGQAIMTWAAEQKSTGPLYVYVADHGVKNSFMVATNQYLTAAQLKAYLDSFQKNTGRNVVVIIEACYSGSFVDDLQSATYNRLVITSVDDSNPDYLSSNGIISFSSFLMSYIYKGKSLSEGFNLTKTDLQTVGLPYSTMASQIQGPESLLSLKVGGDFVLAGIFPEITGNTTEQSFTAGDTLSLFANVTSAIGGLEVWAVIVPPDYTPPQVTGDYDTPVDELPKVVLVDEDADKILDGKYEGFYSDFAYNGVYKVIFYAKDAENNLVKTAPVNITVSGGQDVPSGANLMVGWNLLSIHVDPPNTSINSVLEDIMTNIVSAWKWVGGNWAVCLPNETDEGASYASSKGFSQLTDITCGEGFWVNSSISQTLTCSGTEPADVSCSLSSGWNLMGLKTNQSKSITDYISGKEGKIASIWKWVNNNWAVYLPGGGTDTYAQSKGFSVLETINPGEGFWMNCTEVVTLN